VVDRRADEVGDLLDPVLGVVHGNAVVGPVDELDVVLAVAERDRSLSCEAQVLG
jgi:hypothetical protein